MGSNQKANKMIDDIAKKFKINRKEFGEYIHTQKKIDKMGGADNYTWKQLEKLAKKYN